MWFQPPRHREEHNNKNGAESSTDDFVQNVLKSNFFKEMMVIFWRIAWYGCVCLCGCVCLMFLPDKIKSWQLGWLSGLSNSFSFRSIGELTLLEFPEVRCGLL